MRSYCGEEVSGTKVLLVLDLPVVVTVTGCNFASVPAGVTDLNRWRKKPGIP